VIEYVPSNCFIQYFRAAVSVVVGPCCPALLNCIDVNVHTVVLVGKNIVFVYFRFAVGWAAGRASGL